SDRRRVGRDLCGREQRLRIHRVAGWQRREQPTHDAAPRIDLARLREAERLDESSVGLCGKMERWNDGKGYDGEHRSNVPSFHLSAAHAASRFVAANPSTSCVT